MEADVDGGWSGDHLDGGLEEDDGYGAVYVIVAVDEDGFAAGDGGLDSRDGLGHPGHGVGIEKMVESGVQEAAGFDGRCNSPYDEQAGEERRDAEFGGERCC